MIRDVNSLVDAGCVTADGNQVDLEFYLGGDYKVNVTHINSFFEILHLFFTKPTVIHICVTLFLHFFTTVPTTSHGDEGGNLK